MSFRNPTRGYYLFGICYIRFFHAEDTRCELQRRYASAEMHENFERIVKDSRTPTLEEWARFVEDGLPQAGREEYLVHRNPDLKHAAYQLKQLVGKTVDWLSG
ncbi:hypothetical protein FOCG_18344 [Fusarium oxysporum f. sp. radicis-lycopersici 26381]|nr:hypothetical protein FOCG_18344 [Fusarium oxysporum f. sp. radicis-lycopersici 26381]